MIIGEPPAGPPQAMPATRAILRRPPSTCTAGVTNTAVKNDGRYRGNGRHRGNTVRIAGARTRGRRMDRHAVSRVSRSNEAFRPANAMMAPAVAPFARMIVISPVSRP